jgi:hypothetical protein
VPKATRSQLGEGQYRQGLQIYLGAGRWESLEKLSKLNMPMVRAIVSHTSIDPLPFPGLMYMIWTKSAGSVMCMMCMRLGFT